jgi:hypothetical protein
MVDRRNLVFWYGRMKRQDLAKYIACPISLKLHRQAYFAIVRRYAESQVSYWIGLDFISKKALKSLRFYWSRRWQLASATAAFTPPQLTAYSKRSSTCQHSNTYLSRFPKIPNFRTLENNVKIKLGSWKFAKLVFHCWTDSKKISSWYDIMKSGRGFSRTPIFS